MSGSDFDKYFPAIERGANEEFNQYFPQVTGGSGPRASRSVFELPPEPEAPPPDRREISKGFSRGLQFTIGSFAEVLPAIAYKLSGNQEEAEAKLAQYRERLERAMRENPAAVQGIENVRSIGDFANYASGVLGELAPNILLALTGAGAGAIGARAALGAAAARAGAATGAVGAGMVPNTAESLVGAVDAAGGQFTDEALAGGLMAGAVKSALDAIPIMRFLGEFGQQAVAQSILKRVGKGALGQARSEGITEGMQEVVDQVAQQLIDQDREFWTDENALAVLNSMAAGAIGGGVMGAGAGALQRGPAPVTAPSTPNEREPGAVEPAIRTPEEARDFLRQNAIPPPANLTEEQVVAFANRRLADLGQRTIEAETTQQLQNFYGLVEQPLPGVGPRINVGQLTANLIRAEQEGRINLSELTQKEFEEAAGISTDGLLPAQRTMLRSAWAGLRHSGRLEDIGNKRFRLQLGERAEDGTPTTQLERDAAEALRIIQQTNPTQRTKEVLKTLPSGVRSWIERYDAVSQSETAEAIAERARITDELEGITKGIVMVPPRREDAAGAIRLPERTDQTRPPESFPPQPDLGTIVGMAEASALQNRLAAAQEVERRDARIREFGRLLRENPQETRQFLDEVMRRGLVRDREGMSWKKFQRAYEVAMGQSILPGEATELYRVAQETGAINSKGEAQLAQVGEVGRPPAPRPERTTGVETIRAQAEPPVEPTFPDYPYRVANQVPTKQTVSLPIFQRDLSDQSGQVVTPADARAAMDQLVQEGYFTPTEGGFRRTAKKYDRSQTQPGITPSPPLPDRGNVATPTRADATNPRAMQLPGDENFSFQEYLDLMEEQGRQIAKAERDFQRILGGNGRLEFVDRMVLGNIDQTIVDWFLSEGRELAPDGTLRGLSGFADGDLAVVSMQSEFPLDQVAIHEGYHIAEHIGLINQRDVEILNRNADRLREGIKKYVSDSNEVDALPLSEVRAYGLNAYLMRGERFGGVVDRIFEKVRQLTERIGNALRGLGYRSAEDVYKDFYSGRMAEGRPSTITGIAPQAMQLAVRRPSVTVPKESGFWFRLLLSPVLTMPKVRPHLRALSDSMNMLAQRTKEFENEVGQLGNAWAQLSSADKIAATRVWEEASRMKMTPDYTRLSPEAAAALRNRIQQMNLSFDYLIESFINEQWTERASQPNNAQKMRELRARYEGVPVTQIPDAELRRTNPKAFETLETLRKMRNPSYMPQMALGTHFYAVYDKSNKKRKLVEIQAFNPRNLVQRATGYADEGAAILTDLQARYGSDPKYEIGPAKKFTYDQQDQNVREQMDAITEILTAFEVMKPTDRRLATALDNLQTRLDKAQLGRLFRPNEGILKAVNDRNEATYVDTVMPRYLMSMAKIQAARFTQPYYDNAYFEANEVDPSGASYFKQLRAYSTSPTEFASSLRSLTFLYLMGGALDTMAVNMLQPIQTTAPMLIRDGGMGALKHFIPAYRQTLNLVNVIFKSDRDFLRKLNEWPDLDERAALIRAHNIGALAPLYTDESRQSINPSVFGTVGIRPQTASATAGILNKFVDWMGKPMATAEQVNRTASFLMFYRAAKENPKMIESANRLEEPLIRTPFEYAVAMTQNTQFLMTKEDRSLIQRFAPGAELLTQFMSFPLKMVEQIFRHAWMGFQGFAGNDKTLLRAGALGFVGMIAPFVALGGIWAVPFAGFGRELLERILGFVWGNVQNFDDDLRQFATSVTGSEMLGEMLVRGGSQALGGPALAGRMSLDPINQDWLNGLDLTTLLGPFGSITIDNGTKALKYYNNGDYWNLAGVVLPRSIGNLIRGGLALSGEDIKTVRGNTILPGGQLLEEEGGRAALMPVGFTPATLQRARDYVTRTEELNRANQIKKERYGKELSGMLTDALRAQSRGEYEDAQANFREFTTRFREILHEDMDIRNPALRANLDINAIKRRAIQDYYGLVSREASMKRADVPVRAQVDELRKLYRVQ